MGILDWIFGRQASRNQRKDQALEVPLLCSGCMDTCTGDNAHVIPWWNELAEDYFTTFRCEKCWLTGLEETEQHVAEFGEQSREEMSDFLARHSLDDIAETVRNAPWADAKSKIEAFLKQLREKEIVLSP
jgi:hypothetical protein